MAMTLQSTSARVRRFLQLRSLSAFLKCAEYERSNYMEVTMTPPDRPTPVISKDLMTWNEVAIASALGIQIRDVHEYFRDGRRVSFLI